MLTDIILAVVVFGAIALFIILWKGLVINYRPKP